MFKQFIIQSSSFQGNYYSLKLTTIIQSSEMLSFEPSGLILCQSDYKTNGEIWRFSALFVMIIDLVYVQRTGACADLEIFREGGRGMILFAGGGGGVRGLFSVTLPWYLVWNCTGGKGPDPAVLHLDSHMWW